MKGCARSCATNSAYHGRRRDAARPSHPRDTGRGTDRVIPRANAGVSEARRSRQRPDRRGVARHRPRSEPARALRGGVRTVPLRRRVRTAHRSLPPSHGFCASQRAARRRRRGAVRSASPHRSSGFSFASPSTATCSKSWTAIDSRHSAVDNARQPSGRFRPRIIERTERPMTRRGCAYVCTRCAG